MGDVQSRKAGYWSGVAATAIMMVALCCGMLVPKAFAYTAAGDRLFAATLVLPQIAPSDAVYANVMTLPLSGGALGTANRATDITITYGKTITERLGLVFNEAYTRLDRVGAATSYGWQNLEGELKYLLMNDQVDEFVLTLGLHQEFGGTGAGRVGASPSGATTPRLYAGKGLGDLDIGYLRPLALTGFSGFQIADASSRPHLLIGGVAIQYSIPYLQSKVHSFALPGVIRGLTPMLEVRYAVPSGPSRGARPTALIAPGVSYAGAGWELAVEALVPATPATGKGVGVTVQFYLALDFVFPDTIGRPLFSAP